MLNSLCRRLLRQLRSRATSRTTWDEPVPIMFQNALPRPATSFPSHSSPAPGPPSPTQPHKAAAPNPNQGPTNPRLLSRLGLFSQSPNLVSPTLDGLPSIRGYPVSPKRLNPVCYLVRAASFCLVTCHTIHCVVHKNKGKTRQSDLPRSFVSLLYTQPSARDSRVLFPQTKIVPVLVFFPSYSSQATPASKSSNSAKSRAKSSFRSGSNGVFLSDLFFLTLFGKALEPFNRSK